MEGGRALVELMYADFLGRAGDEVFNQLAKWRGMSGGDMALRVVVRLSIGAKYGAQHSQDWTALCAHVPGLQVVYPATPFDAKGMLAAALSSDDPVMFFESQRDYDVPELFHVGGVPTEYYTLPIGQPDIKRVGSDVTILSIGSVLYRAVTAAERLATLGVETELIDARSLVPFNYEPVLKSLAKTGRILLVSDACERGSFLASMAATIQRLGFDSMNAPVAVLGARNWITPPSEFESAYFPQADTIIDAVHNELFKIPGYTPTQRRHLAEEALRGV
jgi:2-oxoisovalerate dehydrogenase E1 component